MSLREHDFEPVRGLPERLPAGEEIVWQGAPDWRVLARRAFHTNKVAAYFAILLAWRAVVVVNDGEPVSAFLAGAAWLVPMGLAAVAILAFMAWLHARATVYTITNRRVVLRCGVAIDMAINLPFKVVESELLKTYNDGYGDLALKLGGDDRLSYLHLWPHARRWHIADPQPMLRAIPNAAEVGRKLATALDAYHRSNAATAAVPDARDHGCDFTSAPSRLAAAS